MDFITVVSIVKNNITMIKALNKAQFHLKVSFDPELSSRDNCSAAAMAIISYVIYFKLVPGISGQFHIISRYPVFSNII